MSSLRVFVYLVVVVVTRQVLDDITLDISCHGDPTLLSSSVTRKHCSLFLVSITFETLCFYNDHFYHSCSVHHCVIFIERLCFHGFYYYMSRCLTSLPVVRKQPFSLRLLLHYYTVDIFVFFIDLFVLARNVITQVCRGHE